VYPVFRRPTALLATWGKNMTGQFEHCICNLYSIQNSPKANRTVRTWRR
jgi:hypothetical protein